MLDKGSSLDLMASYISSPISLYSLCCDPPSSAILLLIFSTLLIKVGLVVMSLVRSTEALGTNALVSSGASSAICL